MGRQARLLLVTALALALGACEPERGEAAQADSYFLWAGVPPPPDLADAGSVYVLAGEVRQGTGGRFISLRPQAPTVRGPQIWLVVRTETLEWDEATYQEIKRQLAIWDGSVELAGMQVDFDAGTRNLDRYGEFLRDLRHRMPEKYRLSITGLLDWSANGDPSALAGLAGVVDEVVVQTYQGRTTIPGYEVYLGMLTHLPFDYRIGIVEDGQWREPPALAKDPHYRGVVIFLTRPSG